jgi:ribosome-associated protein
MEVILDQLMDGSAAVAKLCARILDENKMEKVKVFDVGSALQITDYFVIASGRTPRHVKAASDEILRRLRERGATRRGLEGYREGKWVLIDLDGVVVHLFLSENREFYDLEHLWGDCPAVDWLEGWAMPPRSPAQEAEGAESAVRVSAGGR